jgi:hypothetical protein
MRPAVERGESLAFEFEFDGEYRAGRLAMDVAPGFGVAADLIDARILKDRGIEIRRLLGLCIEPQTWRDLLFADRYQGLRYSA